jgi:lipopolysaccharide/colanic/teichoic acid biosynthesis glycosyltransferase
MLKFRSMCVNADRTGVNSTSGDDARITPMGRFIRATKLDELIQLWNVLVGDMSLVGPRSQILAEAEKYTEAEKTMLSVRPGVTDLASIVFADEGEILRGSTEPDRVYDQMIRPWKSRLALLYVANHSFFVDLEIVALTLLGLFFHRLALRGVGRILRKWKADPLVIRMALRRGPLQPYPPPGTPITCRNSAFIW